MYHNDFSINIPLQKINKQKRIVTGIATANNIDLEGDQIDFEASMEAFSSWVGNIREMHQPKAVGTLVDFRPTQIMYKGRMIDAIEVDVYISKGAQDTWEKIIDGTLKGFSIGGRALEREMKLDPESGEMVQYVSKYVLNELSVVDNPCNPAGMFMLIKMAPDGSLENATDEIIKSVYYCAEHKYATLDNKFCPTCSLEMKKIGEVDTFNAEVINKMIATYDKDGGKKIMDLHKNTDDATISNTMNDLTEQQKSSIASRLVDSLFGSTSTPAVTVPNVTVNIHKGMLTDVDDEAKIEKKADVVEDTAVTNVDSVKEEEMDIDELLKGVGALLDTKLDAVKSDISAEIDEKVSAISKSVDDFKAETSETLTKTAEDLEKVSSAGAIQKSVDVDDADADADKIEKNVKTESFWGNIFVPVEFVDALGYES